MGLDPVKELANIAIEEIKKELLNIEGAIKTMSVIEIGSNPLPIDAQEKLGEFLDWLDVHYEIDQGATALFWGLSYDIGNRIVKKGSK
jgi:hypothetical protein